MNSHPAIRIHWFVWLWIVPVMLSLASCGPAATPTPLPATSTPIPTLVRRLRGDLPSPCAPCKRTPPPLAGVS